MVHFDTTHPSGPPSPTASAQALRAARRRGAGRTGATAAGRSRRARKMHFSLRKKETVSFSAEQTRSFRSVPYKRITQKKEGTDWLVSGEVPTLWFLGVRHAAATALMRALRAAGAEAREARRR